jgi:hypothetical protein
MEDGYAFGAVRVLVWEEDRGRPVRRVGIAIPLLLETWVQMISVHLDLRLDCTLIERGIERCYAWWPSASAWIVLNLRLSGQLRRWVGDMKEFSLLGVLDIEI